MGHVEPFTLRLSFQGICLFTRAPGAGSLDEGMVVLLPGGRDTGGNPRYCPDGTQLTRHSALFRFRLKNAFGARAVPEVTIAWPMRRQRLELLVREAPGACNRLHVTHGTCEGSFDFVPNLSLVAPGHGDIASFDLTPEPSDDIQLQAQIDKGRVYTHADPETWTFPASAITPRAITQRLAHQVVVELRDIIYASFLFTTFGANVCVESLRLAPAVGEEPLVEVGIYNFEPVGVPKPRLKGTDPDVDFKWYFELLRTDEYQDLQNLRVTLPAPAPSTISVYDENTKMAIQRDQSLGRDCFSAQSS